MGRRLEGVLGVFVLASGLAFAVPAVAEPKPAPGPRVQDQTVDWLLDLDQPRQQKPNGPWYEQVYVGPRKYDRLFLQAVHRVPGGRLIPEPGSRHAGPRGPLADIARVEVRASGRKAPIASLGKRDLTYKAEHASDFEHDGRGHIEFVQETLRIRLGATVGKHVEQSHPYEITVTALAADGAVVFEKTFAGDEGGEYPTIQPPRPY